MRGTPVVQMWIWVFGAFVLLGAANGEDEGSAGYGMMHHTRALKQ